MKLVTSPTVSAEVVVLGGGPAGCAVARLLSAWDHDVCLVTRAHAVASLPESIPPSCAKLFDVLGVREAIDAAGFVRSTGNTVWWGDSDPRIERFADGARGWQVSADVLESILRAAATASLARVEFATLTSDDVDRVAGTFVIDCSGRTGLIARGRGWRTYEQSHRTVALVGHWRAPRPWPIPDATHTVIESYGDGWVWSVPDAAGDRFVAVMVDPRVSNLVKQGSARAVYSSELAKTKRLAAMLDEASLVGGPWGWDASMYKARQYAAGNALLVGDAGSFIDPLSSAGVQKALASGWLAAIAVHTALVRPAMRETALDFFSAREAEMYTALRTTTERFLASAAANHPQPFWAARSDASDVRQGGDLNSDALRDDGEVKAAFAQLRKASALNVRRGDDVRIEQRAAISGSEIVLESRLVTMDRPNGIRFFRDVDLVLLLELAPTAQQVPDLFDHYQRHGGPVGLTDFLAALAVALAKRWLVWRERPTTA